MSFVSPLGAAYRGKRVFVTGHTGFKGSWLCEWLLRLGAEVRGFSLAPEEGALFVELGLEKRLAHHQTGDIRDRAALGQAIEEFRPDHVFHMAAQPLVRVSYEQPLETFETNVNGTIHLLEALRQLRDPCAAVFVTTDKCYENREWLHGYREADCLGGNDPYSASKAMAELAIASYRRSFFTGSPVRIASARAGNVLGGGDWAADRIVPDAIRALKAGLEVPVRNPSSTRPWQHVLEPLGGYLLLGARLLGSSGADFCTAFNFGPWTDSNRSVRELVDEILKHWPGEWVDTSDAASPHEAHLLHLSIDKACHLLGWKPVWNFAKTVEKTVDGYRTRMRSPGRSRNTRRTAAHE